MSGWILAEVLEAVEADTPYGGRSISRTEFGQAWLRPGREAATLRIEEGQRRDGLGREGLKLSAEARVDERLAPGRVLRFRGGDWRIREATPRDGRLRLGLEAIR